MCMVALSTVGQGQITLNSEPIDSLDAPYIEIVGASKLLKPFLVTVYVDFGQISKFKEVHRGHVLEVNNEGIPKPKKFNGMMGVVNFFVQYGYTLEFAYPVTTSSGNVYHYIMKKIDV